MADHLEATDVRGFVERVLASLGNEPSDAEVSRAAQRIARFVADVWRERRRAMRAAGR